MYEFYTTYIVQPIFNLLVLIYALLPAHNFGLAIIIFTIVIRLLLWPLVKKQLHQAKQMRKIQPELKRIAKETKGNRQKQSQMQMELYKERGINPFGSIGVALLQLPILLGLYSGLSKVIKDPNQIVEFAYKPLQNLGWMQQLDNNIRLFDSSLFGIVDLGRAAIGSQGFYLPAMILVIGSAVTQYYQAKQLMPNDKDARSLREILRDAGNGKQADQSEVGAAVIGSTRFLIPVMIFVFTVNIASALSLYWFVGGLVAFIQQSIILRDDKEEMAELTNEKSKPIEKSKTESVADKPEPSSSKLANVSKKLFTKDADKIPEGVVITYSNAKDTDKESKSGSVSSVDSTAGSNSRTKNSRNKNKKRRRR